MIRWHCIIQNGIIELNHCLINNVEDIVVFLIHTSSADKAFKDTVVNQALPSLKGGSLENTLTVPLKGKGSRREERTIVGRSRKKMRVNTS